MAQDDLENFNERDDYKYRGGLAGEEWDCIAWLWRVLMCGVWHVIIAIPRAELRLTLTCDSDGLRVTGGHGTHGIMQHWPPDSDQKIHSMEILWDI